MLRAIESILGLVAIRARPGGAPVHDRVATGGVAGSRTASGPASGDVVVIPVDDPEFRFVDVLGEPAARVLLRVLRNSDADRATLIGRLYAREDARWLAELLMDLEGEDGEPARLQLVDSLREELARAESSAGRDETRLEGRRVDGS